MKKQTQSIKTAIFAWLLLLHITMAPSVFSDPLTEEEAGSVTQNSAAPVVTPNETATTPTEEKNPGTNYEDQKMEEMYKRGMEEVLTHMQYGRVRHIGRIALNHPLPRVRMVAVTSLGRIKKGSEYLMRAIDRDGEVVRQAAYEALAKIGPRRAIRYFIRGCRSKDERIQIASFEGLGQTRDPVGRQLILEEGIRSSRVSVVTASIRSLAFFHNDYDLDTISSFLGSSDLEVYQAALDALSTHKSIQSLYILENEFFRKTENHVPVIRAVAGKKNIQSTLVLIRFLLKNDSPEVKDKIGVILNEQKRYGKFAYITSPRALLRKSTNERSEVIKELTNMDIGVFKKSSKMRFIVKRNDSQQENYYYYIQFPYLTRDRKIWKGWVFGNDVAIMRIQRPSLNQNYSTVETE